jgi:sulfotransferase family protein
MRIAMWSGPRNISTAMMYSFAARDDCAVWDEPFYAAYLTSTGLDHPMRREILAKGEPDAAKVIAACLGPTPDSAPVFYQKHMTQHMIPGLDRSWINDLTNVFLIRDPARVIASYAAKRQSPTLDDIGFRQQAELFDQVCQHTGKAPPVLDSHRIRKDPESALRKLCDTIDLPFQMAMLNWPEGGHKDDGVWASHWYGAVWQSTGFAGAEDAVPDVPDELGPVWEQAQFYYEKLASFVL